MYYKCIYCKAYHNVLFCPVGQERGHIQGHDLDPGRQRRGTLGQDLQTEVTLGPIVPAHRDPGHVLSHLARLATLRAGHIPLYDRSECTELSPDPGLPGPVALLLCLANIPGHLLPRGSH